MATVLVMPKLGLTMKEGVIGEWYVKEGDKIAEGDRIYSVESDKLTNDVESNVSGTLLKILLESGDKAPVNEPVCIIGEEGEDISDLLDGAGDSEKEESKEKPKAEAKEEPKKKASGGRILASPAVKKLAKEKGIDLAEVEGSGPRGRIVLSDIEDLKPKKKASGGRILASPAVKKLAKEKGIDLAEVEGSGPKGRIVLSDIENYKPPTESESKEEKVKATPVAKKMAVDKEVDLEALDVEGRVYKADVEAAVKEEASAKRETRVPMDNMRRIIAERMTDSVHTSPMVTFDISADIKELKKLQKKLRKLDYKFSYTTFLVKIVSKVLLEMPILNSSVEGDEIIYRDYVNMGVATAIESGLLVPVIKDAHLKGLEEISQEIAEYSEGAKSNNLSPDVLTGGTFTISNLGMFGIESFTPIINQPEVAILGVNTIEDKLYLDEGEVKSKEILRLSLTADHRVVDGAVAAQFLARLKELIESPLLLFV